MSFFKREQPKPIQHQHQQEPFVRQTVMAKVKMGQPGDKFEKEADATADKVVNKTSGGAENVQAMQEEEKVQQQPIASGISSVQKKDLAGDEEPVQSKAEGEKEEPVQMKEDEEPVQAKEDEEPVQAKEDEEPVQMKEDEEPVQAKEDEESVQAKEDEEPVQAKEEEEPVQPKATAAPKPKSATSIESKLKSSKGGGQKLSGKAKSDMEAGFGADFSNVNIHTDGKAAEMSDQIGAQAFTHGNDVYFNQGKYDPASQQGKHLLAHELTHTIQQSGMVQKQVQRHMQTSYPWDGVVSGSWGAAVREVPKKDKWIADIPKGTRLTVIGNSGNWLNVRIMVDGIQRTGYMSQELVSLAKTNVVAEMESMVGEEAKWVRSGPSRLTGSANTFVTWAEAKTEADAPSVQSVTTINCWEMILLAAYRSGALTWDFIHKLYLNNKGSWGKELPNRLTSGAQTPYSVTTKKPTPKRGQLVFFDGASHVALATGKGDEILTFWPPPNTKFKSGGTVDDVKTSSISALYYFMKKHMTTPKVTIGDPIW